MAVALVLHILGLAGNRTKLAVVCRAVRGIPGLSPGKRRGPLGVVRVEVLHALDVAVGQRLLVEHMRLLREPPLPINGIGFVSGPLLPSALEVMAVLELLQLRVAVGRVAVVLVEVADLAHGLVVGQLAVKLLLVEENLLVLLLVAVN